MEGTMHLQEQPTPDEANFVPVKVLVKEIAHQVKLAEALQNKMEDVCLQNAVKYTTLAAAHAANDGIYQPQEVA